MSENYMLISLFRRGAFFTKLSFIIFGAANMAHKQIVKGLIFLAAEAAYIRPLAKLSRAIKITDTSD